MSISIGQNQLFQTDDKVFTIMSERSNVFNLDSADNNVLINIGKYQIGQSLNNTVFSLKFTSEQTDVFMSFSEQRININKQIISTGGATFEKNISTLSNISSRDINTSNIMISNLIPNTVFFNATSNQVVLVSASNTNNGTMYIGGQLHIGMAASNNSYSLLANSNIYTKTDIYASNAQISEKVYSKGILNISNISDGIIFDTNGIEIKSTSAIKLNSPSVVLNNFSLTGTTTFDSITVSNNANISGIIYSSNLILTNKNSTTNPLKINHKLINNQFSSLTSGNPISVNSQFPSGDINILQFSPYGHMIFGDNPTATDYMIRGTIPHSRKNNFTGLLYLSSSYSNITSGFSYNKSEFVVNSEGYLSIGTSNSTSMLEIKNRFNITEGYTPPSSLLTLSNTFLTNNVPMLKCFSPSTNTLQITSNASLCFTQSPVNTTLYQIESDKTSYFNTIELTNLKGFNSTTINFNQSVISNILTTNTVNVSATNANITTATIETINVVNLKIGNNANTTTQNTGSDLFSINTGNLIFNGKNIILNNNSILNTTLPADDTIRLYTNGTTNDVVNSHNIIGNNKEIVFRTNNTRNIGGRATQEFDVNNNIFKLGIVDTSTTASTTSFKGVFYITPFVNENESGISNNSSAISIFRNKTVKFGGNTYIYPTGNITIGGSINTSDNVPNGLYINGGNVSISSLANTTSFYIDSQSGNIGIGTITPESGLIVTKNAFIGQGIYNSGGGPFYKQGSWTTFALSHNLLYVNYGCGITNTSMSAGTLNLQVKNSSNRMATISLQFIKDSIGGSVSIFNISKSVSSGGTNSLPDISVTASGTSITISTTAVQISLSWTTIGSSII